MKNRYQQTSTLQTITVVLLSALFAHCTAATGSGLDGATSAVLDQAIAGEHRSPENRARDKYRHPKETLAFFGFRSDMTVVEIWPAGGWYTEILAPALRDNGIFYAAQYSVNPPYSYQRRYLGAFLTKIGSAPDTYGEVIITTLDFPRELEIAPAGSADLVVTFRNAHNWVGRGYPEGSAQLAFRAFYAALKPGGVLGLVDHRWPGADDEDPVSANGYISEERLVAFAEAAGFEFGGRSDVNRNPKDTHDHPNGVWTLPPSLRHEEQDREKYLAIGESDRLTIKFVKPVK
ncbi:MAG: class I SAM-dependent methyltransferase [Woeseia sp.]